MHPGFPVAEVADDGSAVITLTVRATAELPSQLMLRDQETNAYLDKGGWRKAPCPAPFTLARNGTDV